LLSNEFSLSEYTEIDVGFYVLRGRFAAGGEWKGGKRRTRGGARGEGRGKGCGEGRGKG